MRYTLFSIAIMLSTMTSLANDIITIDACKDEMDHVGSGKTDRGKDNNYVTGNVGSTPYQYEIWYQGGNNSMTYYDNGTYKASWSNTSDFRASVGFKYDEDKTYEELGPIDAYFKWNKQGNAGGYNYIGIHGWTVNPLVEFFIIEDWFNKPGTNILGQRKGEFTVDGDTYEIYQSTCIQQPSIKGTQTFPQYFCVRKSARYCGHIDVNAHFKKWESIGMRMGKMYEAKMFIETSGGSGSFDVTYFKMTDKKNPLQKTITAENITIAAATYDGTAQTPNVIVKDGETTLTKDIDYEITQQSEEMINANCYQITITGKGFYKGEVNCDFTIDPKPFTSESINVQDIASKTYTGEALTPEVIVTDGEKKLVEGTDYEVELPEGGCTDANDYQININGKGNYTGTIERTFTITAASPTAVGEQNADKVSVSTNGTSIVISNAPIGAAYKVTTVGGQSIANGIAKCEKETINITQSGIYIVTINGVSYKVAK